MLTELRKKSQITIPKEVVEKLGLYEGDKLEITEENGAIKIIPVAVYPRKYISDLLEEMTEIKRQIKLGKQPIFDSVDNLFAHLDSEQGQK